TRRYPRRAPGTRPTPPATSREPTDAVGRPPVMDPGNHTDLRTRRPWHDRRVKVRWRSGAGRLDPERAQEDLHPSADLVAHGPHAVEVQAGRVVEGPVLVALAGEDRAGVAAAHRDDDV